MCTVEMARGKKVNKKTNNRQMYETLKSQLQNVQGIKKINLTMLNLQVV